MPIALRAGHCERVSTCESKDVTSANRQSNSPGSRGSSRAVRLVFHARRSQRAGACGLRCRDVLRYSCTISTRPTPRRSCERPPTRPVGCS